MNRSLGLVLITLLLVALGCSLDNFTGGKTDVPTPVTRDSGASGTTAPSAVPTGDTGSEGGVAGAVSIANFDKIALGMSHKEVSEIMGSDGNQTSMSKGASYETASYEWKGDDFARISARFSNDELVFKSQSGLTPTSGSADISQAKFKRIELGMSYDEVRKIIGSDGEMTSTSKVANSVSTSYRWKGEDYSNIFAVFRDDKLQTKNQSRLK